MSVPAHADAQAYLYHVGMLHNETLVLKQGIYVTSGSLSREEKGRPGDAKDYAQIVSGIDRQNTVPNAPILRGSRGMTSRTRVLETRHILNVAAVLRCTRCFHLVLNCCYASIAAEPYLNIQRHTHDAHQIF